MPRRTFSTEQKAAVIKRHLVDKVAVSALCEEYKLQPSLLYGWLNQVYENLGSAFEQREPSASASREKQLTQKVEQLEAKLSKRDEVIAEISAEYVHLKKELGEP